MLAALQRSISAIEMGRDAFEMSVSLLQNFWNPPPVPEIPTVTRTRPLVARWNYSAMASVTGKTVDEPSMAMTPLVSVFNGTVAANALPAGAACSSTLGFAAGASVGFDAGAVGAAAGLGASAGCVADAG
jgi:hypothetical protein